MCHKEASSELTVTETVVRKITTTDSQYFSVTVLSGEQGFWSSLKLVITALIFAKKQGLRLIFAQLKTENQSETIDFAAFLQAWEEEKYIIFNNIKYFSKKFLIFFSFVKIQSKQQNVYHGKCR